MRGCGARWSVLVLGAMLVGVACATWASAEPAESDADVLARIGARATTGAAPGYLADATCATCHSSLHESFQHVGMARSLQRPRRERAIEDFAGTGFHHAKSDQYFRMYWNTSGELTFQRWQQDPAGERFNVIEQRVDWLLGSGHRARVYLYRNAAGELFQLPIAWYAEESRWAMAPGYDRPDHESLGRRVRRECLFCHNAYPEVDSGSDAAWQPAVFPESLPEGIGCQRCHGPGAAHVRAVLGGSDLPAIRAAIVNPRALSPARRDDVCFQCHLQPSVAIMGLRRDGRDDYSFRPGEALSDYLLHVEVEESGRNREQRFEINHHGYRLQQSPCHREGGLTCIDCHDPHVALKRDPRVAAAAEVCARCHQPHAVSERAGQARENCIACHMPRRRTQDVVHVVMTDHGMPRTVPEGALAPISESEPVITGLEFLDPEAAPAANEGVLYRSRSVLQAVASRAALDALDAALDALDPASAAPWMDAVSAELRLGRFAAAGERVESLLRRWPALAQLHAWQGVSAFASGDYRTARAALLRAIERAPGQAEFHLNLALAEERLAHPDAARAAVGRALELRPNLVPAWITQGRLLAEGEDAAGAGASYARALALDPRNTRAWEGAIEAARAAGDTDQVERLRSRAQRLASQPERFWP